jgi:hypothetical protein
MTNLVANEEQIASMRNMLGDGFTDGDIQDFLNCVYHKFLDNHLKDVLSGNITFKDAWAQSVAEYQATIKEITKEVYSWKCDGHQYKVLSNTLVDNIYEGFNK